MSQELGNFYIRDNIFALIFSEIGLIILSAVEFSHDIALNNFLYTSRKARRLSTNLPSNLGMTQYLSTVNKILHKITR